jgi:DNA repair photolyase
VKKNAAELVEDKIRKSSWKATPLMLAGNTDCYQPIEKELEITRSILQVLWKWRHPVGIITKNSLILRDLDVLIPMAQNNLVQVSISITTLN